MYIFIWSLIWFYIMYIFTFLVILLLSFWYFKSNKVLKIKLSFFKIEMTRKRFFKSLIVPIFIMPIIILLLIFSYTTENTKLILSDEYVVVNDPLYNNHFLLGPSYTHIVDGYKGYMRSDYGIVEKLQKINDDTWIGYIGDENKSEKPYYNKFVDADENSDRIFKMMIIAKIEETKGYFIINEKEAIFGLSKEEIEKRINKKIKFPYPTIYYLKKYGEK